MADSYVTSKATLKCSFGDKTAKLTVYPDRTVELTEKGEKIGEYVIKRNRVIFGLLTDLGVDKKTAAEDACNMEHGISEETLTALCDLRQFLRVIRRTSSLQQTDE